MRSKGKINLSNKLKKSQPASILKMIFKALCLSGMLLIISCKLGEGGSTLPLPQKEEGNAKSKEKNLTSHEIVVFCGNPGVGKSSLCNAIFQEPVFRSGARVGKGKTTHKQELIHNNRLYIDTPGLDDIEQRKQAAEEIERALKYNDNYKIVFVATLESGSIRATDLNTINTICDAITTDFEYGIIFNKVTNPIIRQIDQKGLEQYLTTLNKKPWSILILKKDSDIEDEEDAYFLAGSENRENLMRFIDNLKANKILEKEVNQLDVQNFQEKIDELEKKYKKELAKLAKKNEKQASKIDSLDTKLERSSAKLKKVKAKQEKAAERERTRELLDIIREQKALADRYSDAPPKERRYGQLKQLRKEIVDEERNVRAKLHEMGAGKLVSYKIEQGLPFTKSEYLLKKIILQELPELREKQNLLDKEYNTWHNQVHYCFNAAVQHSSYGYQFNDRSDGKESDREAYIDRTYNPDKDGNFLVHLWAQNTKQDYSDFIAQKALDINAKNKEGLTPLHLAVRLGDNRSSAWKQKIEYLLQNKANPNIYFPNGETMLFSVIKNASSVCNTWNISLMLLKHGADPCRPVLHSGYSRFYRYIKNWTALHAAVERQDVGSVLWIVKYNKAAAQIRATVEKDGRTEDVLPADILPNFYGEQWNGNFDKIYELLKVES